MPEHANFGPDNPEIPCALCGMHFPWHGDDPTLDACAWLLVSAMRNANSFHPELDLYPDPDGLVAEFRALHVGLTPAPA